MHQQVKPSAQRLISIDALRGFAMFLILSIDIGGAPIFRTFAGLCGDNAARLVAEQLSYSFTEGLRLCFLAMPMFLFVVGLTIPMSLNDRLRHDGKTRVYLHIIRRSLILFLLGLIAGGHLLQFQFAHMPLYNNVLEYISIGYLVCAVLTLHTTAWTQLALTATLLLSYWAIYLLIPVPGWQGERFSSQMNLAIYVDNMILGPFHKPGSWQVLATISFVANILLGVLMGQVLASNRSREGKAKLLFICGFAMLLTGFAWGRAFPIIRSLWTSSFVLATCGISTLSLAALYLVIDVWGHAKWALFFVVFGVNSIAIYMMAHLFDFRLIGNIFVGGLSSLCAPEAQEFIQAAAAMAVMWLIMYWMYRCKTFIKV